MYIHIIHILHYVTLHYITLHSIAFHSIPFHSIPFHSIPFHSIPFHSFHSIPLHYITLHSLHYSALHYITLHYITYTHTYIYTYMHVFAVEPLICKPFPQDRDGEETDSELRSFLHVQVIHRSALANSLPAGIRECPKTPRPPHGDEHVGPSVQPFQPLCWGIGCRS